MQLEQVHSLLSGTQSSPLPLLAMMLLAALLPMALLACTSMLKISVVLAILRSALGAGQIPSAPVAGLLSLVLTWYIMTPIGVEVRDNLTEQITAIDLEQAQPIAVSAITLEVLTPLKTFMESHIGQRERAFFLQLSTQHSSTRQLHFSETIPAFALSQLREALLLGCAIFLPFLVIDLVVANLLVGLGMVMVSPMQISLPLKLLLFTLCDGWLLLAKSLLLSYQ